MAKLTFDYAPGLQKSESSELSMKLATSMWLEPLELEIERQKATVHVFFFNNGNNYISLNGANASLSHQFSMRLRQFVNRN